MWEKKARQEARNNGVAKGKKDPKQENRQDGRKNADKG